MVKGLLTQSRGGAPVNVPSLTPGQKKSGELGVFLTVKFLAGKARESAAATWRWR